MEIRLDAVDETIELLNGISSGKLFRADSHGSRESRPPAPDLTIPLARRARAGGDNGQHKVRRSPALCSNVTPVLLQYSDCFAAYLLQKHRTQSGHGKQNGEGTESGPTSSVQVKSTNVGRSVTLPPRVEAFTTQAWMGP